METGIQLLSLRFHLLELLRAQPGVSIGDLDAKLLSALDDRFALTARHGVEDFGSVSAALHQQNLEVLGVFKR